MHCPHRTHFVESTQSLLPFRQDTGFRADFINSKGADALDLITDLYAAHTANAFIDIQFDRRIGMVHFAFGNKLSRVRRF